MCIRDRCIIKRTGRRSRLAPYTTFSLLRPNRPAKGSLTDPRRLTVTRPILAQINLAALRANLHVARQRAPGAQILAVVKANAYGHGLMRVPVSYTHLTLPTSDL